MKFDKVIVLGSGKIAVECINILVGYRDDVIVIEQEVQPLSFVRLISRKCGLEYQRFLDKCDLTAYLNGIEEETLVISANNSYLFPRQIVEKKNFSIINFHNALLPHYPGRNAPTWVIFNGEEITGITWHFVDVGVDTGDILIQKTVLIGPGVTALELTKQCIDIGIEAFHEIIPGILAGEYSSYVQDRKRRVNFHHAKDVPNNGYLNVCWSLDKISAFLRSLDYARAQVVPLAKVVLFGQEYLIRKYSISVATSLLSCHVVFRRGEMILRDGKHIVNMALEKG